MSDCKINIRFFMWHFKIHNNWKHSWTYNAAHKGLKNGWFSIYEFNLFK
jgi:hypothetical protein